MVCALDEHELLWLWERFHEGLQLCSRAELIAGATHEQFRLAALAEKVKVVAPAILRSERKT